jgi:O-antigen ligase
MIGARALGRDADRSKVLSRSAARVYRGVLFGAIIWGTLAFGAPYPWAYWPLAGVCAGLGIWALVSTDAWRVPRISALVWALGAAAVAMAAQIVPLPYSLFVLLNPSADRFFRAYQIGYGLQPPSTHTLSLAPDATALVLLLFVLLAVFMVGLPHALRQIRLEWLITRLIGFGVVLAVFGVVQRSFNYKEHKAMIYGFWEPSATTNSFGPFLNRNHFAGWMILVLPLAMGYACAVMEQSRGPYARRAADWMRWSASPDASKFLLAVATVFAMGTALVLTGSRSGIGGFAVSLLALAYFAFRRFGGRTRGAIALGLLIVLFGGAIAWAGFGSTLQRFAVASGDVPDRIGAWRDALTIARDFPIVGVGMGNFGLAMLLYQTGARYGVFMQAHNDYLQILAEGGLMVAIPVVVAVVIIVGRIRRRFVESDRPDDTLTFWFRASAVAALAGMAAQAMLEFSLQIPGITVLFLVVLAVALHSAGFLPSTRSRSSQR